MYGDIYQVVINAIKGQVSKENVVLRLWEYYNWR